VRKLALLLWLTTIAGAATIQFSTLPDNTTYGTYNGFAIATVDGVTQLLVCDDYGHTTYMPSPAMAFLLSTLTGADPLEYARFLNPNEEDLAVFRYRQAAWLVDGMSRTGRGSELNLTADYQHAIWHLFTPTAPLPSQTAQTLLDDAAAAVQNGFTDPAVEERLRIYTPQYPYVSNQEFLGLAPPSLLVAGDDPDPAGEVMATPEPAAITTVAIGVGLIILMALSRRWRHRLTPVRIIDKAEGPPD
jgi:hypothetical protein